MSTINNLKYVVRTNRNMLHSLMPLIDKTQRETHLVKTKSEEEKMKTRREENWSDTLLLKQNYFKKFPQCYPVY